uniref:Uncharacterized protein n=1 Tax=Rhizophora mucronata TaxID=61149 RepID=A0A2P2Q347_RHIMU
MTCWLEWIRRHTGQYKSVTFALIRT